MLKALIIILIGMAISSSAIEYITAYGGGEATALAILIAGAVAQIYGLFMMARI